MGCLLEHVNREDLAIRRQNKVVTRQPAISFSNSVHFHFNCAGGRTSNVSRKMITAIPDRPPTWLRLLAMSSAIFGGLLGALLLSFTIDFDRSEYTVSRKYVSEHGNQYRIFAEVFPGGSSIDDAYRKNLFDAAAQGDKLILRGYGLNTVARAGKAVAWEISDDVLMPLVFISAAFLPLLLLQRFRRAWVRGVCYPVGGLLASLITLYAVLGMFAHG